MKLRALNLNENKTNIPLTFSKVEIKLPTKEVSNFQNKGLLTEKEARRFLTIMRKKVNKFLNKHQGKGIKKLEIDNLLNHPGYSINWIDNGVTYMSNYQNLPTKKNCLKFLKVSITNIINKMTVSMK